MELSPILTKLVKTVALPPFAGGNYFHRFTVYSNYKKNGNHYNNALHTLSSIC